MKAPPQGEEIDRILLEKGVGYFCDALGLAEVWVRWFDQRVVSLGGWTLDDHKRYSGELPWQHVVEILAGRYIRHASWAKAAD